MKWFKKKSKVVSQTIPTPNSEVCPDCEVLKALIMIYQDQLPPEQTKEVLKLLGKKE